MAHVRSFPAIHFDTKRFHDVSGIISPPFDVLNEEQRAALRGKHPNNIVNIDLPHIPPKAAGPAEVYAKSAMTLQAWLDAGIFTREHRTAFYPYAQSYDHNGRQVRRRGFFALVRLSPFGQGEVVPHEQTYKGAIEDRFALMKATKCQLSPIFGLFNDRNNEITNLLYASLGQPNLTGTMEGVKSDLWKVSDPELEVKVQDMMGTKPIYIADGNHRYTTALEYQKLAIEENGGKPLPMNHPANYCMFVLISMNDPGLIIQATHRLIGGLDGFDIKAFADATSNTFNVSEINISPEGVKDWINETLPKSGQHAFGIFDGTTKKLYQAKLINHDVLKPLEPGHSDGWRSLDVAILQRYLLDEIMKPKFAGGREITKAYVSDPALVAAQTDGVKNQVAFILQPTPLHSLEELGRHNEVMPPKSTYFYPKLATGLVINPLG